MFESSKMCTAQSRALECPWNTCRAVPSALLCRIMFTSRCQKENQKHPKKDIFSVLSISVCRTRPTKIRISVSQLYQKLRGMHMKGRFHDTPVQLVKNVHRYASCTIGQVMLQSSAHWARKLKTWSKAKAKHTKIAPFRCYLKLCVHWTWNQEGILSDRTVGQFLHYAQNTVFLTQKFELSRCKTQSRKWNMCRVVPPAP